MLSDQRILNYGELWECLLLVWGTLGVSAVGMGNYGRVCCVGAGTTHASGSVTCSQMISLEP